MAALKRDIASGLIVLLPLIVTAYIVAVIYNQLAAVPVPIEYRPLRVLLTLVVFFLLVLSIGYLGRTAFGDVIEEVLDNLVNRLPGLRVVYNASKMAVETAVSGTEELQTPVKIETWNGMRMTAFKTGKTTEDGRDVIFLPTAPNITTGFVIEVESDDYTETDESVEDALTRILSAGFGESSDDGISINVTDELTGDGEQTDGDATAEDGTGAPEADDD
ncbi:DUF502 domain-containing protein [Halorientalis litorea]|jgi:uncharacterized membrane protein|uniref:DUF502 domain-containing protein n=1 Tax=Halorientalis litorea TaxID=2931977 RepID=UPI001FF1C2C2|nr:DUF502 domain-containing protein [Halorientalis litorea]